MKKSLAQFFLFILISVLIVYAYFLTKASFGTLIDFKPQVEIDEAKVFIKNFTLDETDGKKPVWKLNAFEAKLFESIEEMHFSKIFFKIFQEDKNDYLIDANTGIYKMNEKLITLTGNVKIKSINGFIFKTSKLLYFTESKNLETDEKISASDTSTQQELSGKGLKANIDDKFFTILEDGVVSSAKDKMDIKSNKVNFYTKDNMVEFIDYVRARKNNINIFCNKMFVYYNRKGFQTMKAYGKVKILIDEDKAYAKEAVLDNKKLLLNGDARFVSKQDEFTGSYIEYDLKTKDIEVKNVSGSVKELKQK